ncbi:MAG: CxxxxCH/CxxCH domain-containing protein [Deltaproteobacteria bacterium]|nr:CxxxxCH/CxxCH domain-containing protein [Deltaproteobacteria bacterium]
MLVVAALGLGACHDRYLLIEGSSCATAGDCAVHPSCSRHENGCICRDRQCYYDPQAKEIDPAHDPQRGCRSCHGSLANAAPPVAVDGSGDTRTAAVGAHQLHLEGGNAGRPVACEECHRVPALTNDEGHIDGVAAIDWGPLARAGGASPTWDAGTTTCAGSYCHGATLEGQSGVEVTAPQWTDVSGWQASCGNCHGLPPGPPHPVDARCEACHLPTAGPDHSIANRSTHVDGSLQVSADDCSGCHGNPDNLAPPADGNRASDPGNAAIGAHQAHVRVGRFSRAVACSACHNVPQSRDSSGHLDTPLPAEVVFAGLSLNDGATPQWNAGPQTCAGTYCHGATLEGGTDTTPSWGDATGAGAACGTCHGLPPPAPHPASAACALCHAPTAGPNLTVADVSTHVDGVVQATDGTCANCHGSATTSAPPPDVDRAVDTTSLTVGAHQSHLFALSGIARPVSCSECHVVPQHLNDPGHVDTPRPAELSFGRLASSAGARPSFDALAAICNNTYCHGATLGSGYLPEPIWTVVDGTQAACGTCHGVPPAGTHPADDHCELCHLPTAGPVQVIADPTTHIDGIVQAAVDCDTCHGQNGNSAPPLDLQGLSETTRLTVGAHQTHLGGGSSSKPVACTECHRVPVTLDQAGHVDTATPAEIAFGPVASARHRPRFVSPACQDTRCHNGAGATVPSPAWNVVDGSQAACGACHGTPPSTTAHQTTAACGNCHLPTAGAGLTIAERTTHVDGILQVSDADCGTCHGSNANPAPPPDLDGSADASDPQVGAHAVHLNGGAVSAAVGCTTCHRVPVNLNDPGHVDTARPAEVVFSGRAVAHQSAPIYRALTATCNGSYCHGAASSGGTNPDPIWNAPQSALCGSCHGLPPDPPHPQGTRCGLCHPPTVAASFDYANPATAADPTIADRSRHVDGVVDVNDRVPCQSCHGTATNAAPPADLAGASSSAKVGAHQQHLSGATRSKAVACGECHNTVNPTTPSQPGHYDSALPAEVIFGALAKTGGLRPTWNGTACGTTWCHGASLTGATDTSPAWTGGARACDDCHGMPPQNAAHGNGTATQCETCHPDTAGPGQQIAHPSHHVDGVVDTAAACDACHGGGGDPTPPNDTTGNAASNAVGVHKAHAGPTIGAPVACADCHKVPTAYADAGHADTALPAEVSFTGKAILDGAAPTFAHSTLTCARTYCHGTTLPGGKTNVVWSDLDQSERACGACHGMPPADAAHGAVTDANTCNLCHQTSAGPNQTIVNKALHVDGVVQVTGGACDACHGAPPTPTNQDYANGGGAHAAHDAAGIECITCHGNNGSGATHNQGGGNVGRANVQIVFATAVSFPGGTTMRNGQTSATFAQSTQTCKVGCHNPVVANPNETPNLNRSVTWTAAAPGCIGCHDTVANNLPNNHAISTLSDAGCLGCHSEAGHMGGTPAFKDPDPADAYAYAPGNVDGLCKTCHDSGTTTAFGGKKGQDVMSKWGASSHAGQQYKCSRCHTYHAAPGGALLSDRRSAACTISGCHNDLLPDFQKVSASIVSHHKIEGGTGIAVGCNDCHNAHVAQPHPNAAINPASRWTIYALPDAAVTTRTRSYNAVCTGCHGSTAPAGVTGAKTPSQASWNNHTSGDHGGRYGCPNCHGWHGTDGTPGAVNRGRLVRGNVMGVNSFPYGGKSTCAASGTRSGTSFSCH